MTKFITNDQKTPRDENILVLKKSILLIFYCEQMQEHSFFVVVEHKNF